MVVSMVVGSLFLLGMVAAAGYACQVLPPGARVPLNAGVPEYSVWLSRRAGLASWLGAGAVAFAALAALTGSGAAAHWSSQALREVLLPAVMLVLLAAETGAVITARQRAGREGAEAPTAEPEPESGQALH